MMLIVLLNIMARSSGTRHAKAVEVGVVCVLVELLRDAIRRITKRCLLPLKHQRKCPEGWFIFTEHTLAVLARVVVPVFRCREPSWRCTDCSLGLKSDG
jgi:hypothetical protein